MLVAGEVAQEVDQVGAAEAAEGPAGALHLVEPLDVVVRDEARRRLVVLQAEDLGGLRGLADAERDGLEGVVLPRRRGRVVGDDGDDEAVAVPLLELRELLDEDPDGVVGALDEGRLLHVLPVVRGVVDPLHVDDAHVVLVAVELAGGRVRLRIEVRVHVAGGARDLDDRQPDGDAEAGNDGGRRNHEGAEPVALRKRLNIEAHSRTAEKDDISDFLALGLSLLVDWVIFECAAECI